MNNLIKALTAAVTVAVVSVTLASSANAMPEPPMPPSYGTDEYCTLKFDKAKKVHARLMKMSKKMDEADEGSEYYTKMSGKSERISAKYSTLADDLYEKCICPE